MCFPSDLVSRFGSGKQQIVNRGCFNFPRRFLRLLSNHRDFRFFFLILRTLLHARARTHTHSQTHEISNLKEFRGQAEQIEEEVEEEVVEEVLEEILVLEERMLPAVQEEELQEKHIASKCERTRTIFSRDLSSNMQP